MSNKLTFDEWLNSYSGCDCNEECLGQAWSFAQAQEQKEIEELKKKVEELESRDINRMFHKSMMEIIELKKKLEKAEDVVRFYGDPEKWLIKTSDSWTKSNPRTYGDSELIENYKHPNKDWIGSIVVGGKKARAYLKENK